MTIGTFSTILIGAVCLVFVIMNMILDRKEKKRQEPNELTTHEIIQALVRRERNHD